MLLPVSRNPTRSSYPPSKRGKAYVLFSVLITPKSGHESFIDPRGHVLCCSGRNGDSSALCDGGCLKYGDASLNFSVIAEFFPFKLLTMSLLLYVTNTCGSVMMRFVILHHMSKVRQRIVKLLPDPKMQKCNRLLCVLYAQPLLERRRPCMMK